MRKRSAKRWLDALRPFQQSPGAALSLCAQKGGRECSPSAHMEWALLRLAGCLHPRYLIWSYTLNIGRYIEITMKPTIAPTSTIITGSRIEVSALMAAST
jgi:hypothetical protein